MVLEEYDRNLGLYEDFKVKVDQLIKEIIREENINYHQITCRTKSRESFSNKLEKKEKYKKLSDITDVVGIRIITYFEDEVDNIAKIIEKEFEIDKENSVDKRELETDRFGYKSLHYVVSFSKSRLKLTEFKKYSNLKLEIQIRTILQHSWAEIEHDIGYKGDITIPNVAKRTFYRVAALLETADSEFLKLKNLLKKYEKQVPKLIENSPDDVLIDGASLVSFILHSKIIRRLSEAEANYVGAKIKFEIHKDHSFIIALLNTCKRLKIITIKDLDDMLISNEANILKAFSDNYESNNKQKAHALLIGRPIFFLEKT